MEKILLIDDDDSLRETLCMYLQSLNYNVFLASNGKQGLEIMEKEFPDLIITDFKMSGFSGIDVLQKVKEFDAHTQVLLITAYEDMQSTINAMQLGAYDYLEKPLELEKFTSIVRRALDSRKLSERLIFEISEESRDYKIEESMIGKTQKMKEIFKSIGKISSNRVSVLIEGESGSGKELVAKIIHYSGVTKEHPFVAVNCTALSETLLESELFGHVKGSFTGAYRDKKGKFELSGEGTIFLDEISEISSSLQIKLLRVLQEKEFEKVGGETLIPLRSRVISATNTNLGELVEQGKFREDLYYRLKVCTIEIPPLRERKDDIPNLVVYLLRKINRELHKNVRKIPYEVMEILQNYDWTGNVRELENVLMQAVVLSKSEILEKENILLRTFTHIMPASDSRNMSIADVEKIHIEFVLNSCNWDKNKACHILGISKPTLYSKIESYQLKQEQN